MTTTVTVCAGAFQLCVCRDSPSALDNRVTTSTPSNGDKLCRLIPFHIKAFDPGARHGPKHNRLNRTRPVTNSGSVVLHLRSRGRWHMTQSAIRHETTPMRFTILRSLARNTPNFQGEALPAHPCRGSAQSCRATWAWTPHWVRCPTHLDERQGLPAAVRRYACPSSPTPRQAVGGCAE